MTETVNVEELLGQVRRLSDRADLEDLVYRYASACDRRDVPSWQAIFTADASAKYGKSDRLEGADTIITWLAQATAPTTWGHHFISTYRADVSGDEADVLAYLISHQIFEQDLDEATMMTSRYQLHCRRGPLGWQISDLDLTVGWYEVRRADQSLLP